MRPDVLELMAEELSERAASPLDSFTVWDNGRRKLDGMAKGRRWDIDREQRAFEKANAKQMITLKVRRWRQLNPAKAKASRKATRKRMWDRAPEMVRKSRRRRLARHRKKHREYWLALYRKHGSAAYERRRDPGKPRHPKTCSACGEVGHNRRRHADSAVSPISNRGPKR